MKKLVKVLLVIALAMFVFSCSGGDKSAECVKLTVEKATAAAKAAGAEIPEEAKKMIQTAAEQGCEVCKKGGDACDAVLEALKK